MNLLADDRCKQQTWKGNTTDLTYNSFATLDVADTLAGENDGGFAALLSNGLTPQQKPSLQQLAVNTMIDGDLKAMISPCGANCSYVLRFDGPYLSCTNSSQNLSLPLPTTTNGGSNVTLPPVFTASWTIPSNESSSQNALATGHLDFVVLHAGYASLDGANSTMPLNYTENTISCYPRRAEYELHQTFQNGGQISNVTVGPVYDLVPLPAKVTPPPNVDPDQWIYNSNGSWGDETTNYMRDANIMALIQAMASPLIGSYTASDVIGGPDDPTIEVNGMLWTPAYWKVANDFQSMS